MFLIDPHAEKPDPAAPMKCKFSSHENGRTEVCNSAVWDGWETSICRERGREGGHKQPPHLQSIKFPYSPDALSWHSSSWPIQPPLPEIFLCTTTVKYKEIGNTSNTMHHRISFTLFLYECRVLHPSVHHKFWNTMKFFTQYLAPVTTIRSKTSSTATIKYLHEHALYGVIKQLVESKEMGIHIKHTER